MCVYLLVCPSVVQCIFLKFSGELEPHSVEVDQGKKVPGGRREHEGLDFLVVILYSYEVE